MKRIQAAATIEVQPAHSSEDEDYGLVALNVAGTVLYLETDDARDLATALDKAAERADFAPEQGVTARD